MCMQNKKKTKHERGETAAHNVLNHCPGRWHFLICGKSRFPTRPWTGCQMKNQIWLRARFSTEPLLPDRSIFFVYPQNVFTPQCLCTRCKHFATMVTCGIGGYSRMREHRVAVGLGLCGCPPKKILLKKKRVRYRRATSFTVRIAGNQQRNRQNFWCVKYVFIIELEKFRIGKSNYGVQNFNIKATTWRIYSLLNIKTLLLTLI